MWKLLQEKKLLLLSKGMCWVFFDFFQHGNAACVLCTLHIKRYLGSGFTSKAEFVNLRAVEHIDYSPKTLLLYCYCGMYRNGSWLFLFKDFR